jgi:hypothetical protein
VSRIRDRHRPRYEFGLDGRHVRGGTTMGKIVVSSAMSVDGYTEGVGGTS